MNTFGQIFRITTFGESHGPALGCVIDGMSAGIKIDLGAVQAMLDRRRPGQSALTTARDEKDRIEVLSGIFEGLTTGMPIAVIVRNDNARSSDYENLRHAFRPSHADFTYQAKYGIRDYRGGGRSSARETLARVIAGAFAMQALKEYGVTITAYTSAIGEVEVTKTYLELDLGLVDSNPVRCPDADTARLMQEQIEQARREGDTLGGVVTCVVRGLQAGVGEPVFGKLQALLAGAMMSINAAKGFEYGMGFAGTRRRGSEMIDTWLAPDDLVTRPHTRTNHSGGIQGGISNGEDIYMRVAFKPVATLMREVETIDERMQPVTLRVHGRHDPCVVPRAVPIVESMAAITVYDALLMGC
ncbi:MAG: chorismate synthase [Muribaculaceae bacterium]